MDARYASSIVDQVKQDLERAARRKGEKPRDHPHPSFLIHQFMFTRAATIMDKAEGHGRLATTLIPFYYPPCVRPIQDLKPLMISDMKLETHHRGSQVLVHVMTPPNRMDAIMVIVEDENGTAVLLQLYNQPKEDKVSNEHIIQEGDVCIIKEPFFKATPHGLYSLDVDHVSDIVWLQITDPRIPLKWRKRLDESSRDIRMKGNAAVQRQDWGEAERQYTNAICTAKSPEDLQLAHLNRSLTNLHLGRPEKALDDAQRSNADENHPREKALFREAKALYSLGKFKLCLEKLLLLVRSNPKNSDAWTEIERVKQRLNEEEAGSYQFSSMYKQAEATPPLIDCATFVGSVAVRDSPGRGKGLFTTKRVNAGELLLCEKAFAYSYAGEDSPIGRSNTSMLINVNTGTLSMGGDANLITQIVQKIYHNPARSKVFTDLRLGDYGDYVPVAVSEVDGAPVVDTFLVTKITQQNSFGSPRTNYGHIYESIKKYVQGEPSSDSAQGTCSVWPLASRINHSHVTNCWRTFIGDMIIVRACQDVEAGRELFFEYSSLAESYEETQKNLRNWGIVCDCALCLQMKATPRSAVQKRESLRQSLTQTLKPTASMAQLEQSKKILEDMEKTYEAGRDGQMLPRLCLWYPYFTLGRELIIRDKLREGLGMYLKGLEALGYIIVACPPREAGEEEKKKARFEIKRWGEMNDATVEAFLEIIHVYAVLAPELCPVAKEYARIVYSVCCGEKETIGTRYLELA
ncbi:hypothetical protein F5Y13DRAFT_191633 [Hypoxylon sp. FL1857]|nr:hypothetical protein F5Y13DRAFT_191633 [Hypoxylon sp. FL1857]